MTNREAQNSVGQAVVYRPDLPQPELGVITQIGKVSGVFVLYLGERTAKLTQVEDIEFVNPVNLQKVFKF